MGEEIEMQVYDLVFDHQYHGRNIKIEDGGRAAQKMKNGFHYQHSFAYEPFDRGYQNRRKKIKRSCSSSGRCRCQPCNQYAPYQALLP